MTAQAGKWTLLGYDTFEGGGEEAFYPLPGKYDTEELAIAAARDRLAVLEETQPTEESGGQEPDGIQDWVYIVRPDGSKYRFTG